MRQNHFVILVIGLMLTAPIALAAPGGLAAQDRALGLGLGAHESVSAWNDDGEDTMPGGAPGAGLPERLTPDPSQISDGALVFDSRHMQHTTHVDPAAFAAVALPRAMITPGLGMFYAWYGAWNDLSRDGVIDDYAEGDPRNEFTWHEAEGSMVAWVWPSNPHVGCRPPAGYGLNNCRDNLLTLQHEAGLRTLGSLERDSARSEAISFEYKRFASGYRAEAGFPTVFLDDGFLMTTWVMSVSNAPFRAGAGAGLFEYASLEEPDQLRDIDRYESLSPDVESAYLASVSTTLATAEAARVAAVAAANGAIRLANESLAEVRDDVDDAIEPVDELLGPFDEAIAEAQRVGGGLVATVVEVVNAVANGGLEAYANAHSAHGLVFPGIAEGIVEEGCEVLADWCPFLRLNLASAVSTPAGGVYIGHRWVSPGTEAGGDRSNLPSFIVGEILSGWWHDANGDGWVGVVCDPGDSASWDAEANRCRSPYNYRLGNMGSHQASDYNDRDEFAPACFFWRDTDHVLVAPDGEWPPGTYLVRNFRGMTGGPANYASNYVPLRGTMVADLRLTDGRTAQCGVFGEGSIYTLDGILLAAGSHLVDLLGSLEKEYPESLDASRDVTMPSGFVRGAVRTGSGLL